MQEIRITKAKFRNFLSYGNLWTEIDFTENLSTFIFGLNLDANSSNGCGKTAMYQALVYALYNKSISGISLQRLINSTNAIKNTTMEVILNFQKAGSEYEIHRKRGFEYVTIFMKDGIDITPDSVAETDKLIEATIGISYELFSKIVVFSGSDTPFLDLPIALQRQHIEELFNITILTEKALKLKKLSQTTDSDIKVEEALMVEKQNNRTAHKKRLQFAEQKVLDWEESRVQGIQQLEIQIEKVKDIDFDKEQLLFDKKLLLRSQLDIIQSQIVPIQKDNEIKYKIYNNSILEVTHLKSNECPYCKQKYEALESKIQELEKLIDTLGPEIDTLVSQVQDLSDQKVSLMKELQEVNERIIYDDLPSLLITKNDLEYIKKRIIDLQDMENPHFPALEELEREELTNIDYSKLDELKVLKENQAFLIKLLTDKNSFIRRKIINRTIPLLNSQLNRYTLELGLQHVVKFEDDMSCSVHEFGRTLDFGNLSAGEKKRVNLSMSLAFRDILFHLHSRINIMLVDEIDSSLCAGGVDAVCKVLKRKTIEDRLSTWVIMHRSEAAVKFDRTLTVTKQGGFSDIEMIINT